MRVCLAFVVLASCAPEPLPAFGETVIAIDTDLPVPQVANRLRIDLYDEAGRWFESRDIARPDPRDWPVSFSVYSDDEENDKRVWVRLRVYPEGRVRDYLGERFRDWGGPIVEPAPGFEPRLIVDGADVTPPREPQPLVAIDRFVRLRIEPGRVRRADVALRAACAGTMPMFDGKSAQSCVDAEKTRQPVNEVDELHETIDPFSGDCTEADADRACVPGGVTIFGSTELTLVPDLPPLPERVVIHGRFLIDRHEVTVARFRAALAQGFAPPDMPTAQEGPLGNSVATTCAWSESDRGREGYALSCVSWHTARAFCQFYGGDLPSEAQWEHLATRASSRGRSRYPWGDEPPTCDRAIYGRLTLAGAAGVCEYLGTGPVAEGAAPGDVTRDGVIGAAGGVDEWMRDSYQDYRAACWGDSPLTNPGCFEDNAPARAVRGGAWASPPTILASAARLGADSDSKPSFIGFRCVYPVSP